MVAYGKCGSSEHWWVHSLVDLKFSLTAAITPLLEVLLPVANWIATDWSPGFLSSPEAHRSTSQLFLKYLAVNRCRKHSGATCVRAAVSVVCLAVPWRIRCSSAWCVSVCVRPVWERKWLKQRQGDLPFIPGFLLIPDTSSLHYSFLLAWIFPINWAREELGQCWGFVKVLPTALSGTGCSVWIREEEMTWNLIA